jgi:hypothetical protein
MSGKIAGDKFYFQAFKYRERSGSVNTKKEG